MVAPWTYVAGVFEGPKMRVSSIDHQYSDPAVDSDSVLGHLVEPRYRSGDIKFQCGCAEPLQMFYFRYRTRFCNDLVATQEQVFEDASPNPEEVPATSHTWRAIAKGVQVEIRQ